MNSTPSESAMLGVFERAALKEWLGRVARSPVRV